jgi:TIR domain-containing protein
VLSTSLREADAVIIVISQASSENRWLMAEIGAALSYFQERGHPLVLPLVIDDVVLPQPLIQIQAVFAPDRNLDKVVSQITHALNALAGRMQAQTEQKREIQARIESNAAEYIRKSLGELHQKEQAYKKIAYFCYFAALSALLGGVSFAFWRAQASTAMSPLRTCPSRRSPTSSHESSISGLRTLRSTTIRYSLL